MKKDSVTPSDTDESKISAVPPTSEMDRSEKIESPFQDLLKDLSRVSQISAGISKKRSKVYTRTGSSEPNLLFEVKETTICGCIGFNINAIYNSKVVAQVFIELFGKGPFYVEVDGVKIGEINLDQCYNICDGNGLAQYHLHEDMINKKWKLTDPQGIELGPVKAESIGNNDEEFITLDVKQVPIPLHKFLFCFLGLVAHIEHEFSE